MGSWTSGSGRNATKETAYWRLSISRLKETHCLKPGRFSISWSSRGEKRASINIEFDSAMTHMRLDYRTRDRGGEWEAVKDTIPLDLTKPHIGGMRYWFVCPSCQKRRGVLYGARLYRCGPCRRMTYSSQYDTMPQNPWSRCHRIREKLGGQAGFSYAFPEKPKGMHWKTYYRLQEEDWRAEEMMCLAMNDRLLGMKRKYKL